MITHYSRLTLARQSSLIAKNLETVLNELMSKINVPGIIEASARIIRKSNSGVRFALVMEIKAENRAALRRFQLSSPFFVLLANVYRGWKIPGDKKENRIKSIQKAMSGNKSFRLERDELIPNNSLNIEEILWEIS